MSQTLKLQTEDRQNSGQTGPQATHKESRLFVFPLMTLPLAHVVLPSCE